MVARELGWSYLDTGAMYRAIAVVALAEGIDVDDGRALGEVAARVDLSIGPEGISLDGVDVTDRIRDPDVTAAVSRVAVHPSVRGVLAAKQRDLASRSNVVIEGRDIGTAVAPGAEVKIFLTASLSERARRRWSESHDEESGLQDIQDDIDRRDREDSGRSTSPLTQAEDAVVLDTTSLPLDEVVQRIVALVRERAS
jgi:cytidylate kinase